MLNCFKVVAKEEGVTGFFKGLAPSSLKVRASPVGQNFIILQLSCMAFIKRDPMSIFKNKPCYGSNHAPCIFKVFLDTTMTMIDYHEKLPCQISGQVNQTPKQTYCISFVSFKLHIKFCLLLLLLKNLFMFWLKQTFVSFMQAGLSVALIFCSYEQCLAVIRGYVHDEETQVTTSTASR